ncbi:hypothetical protein [Gluconacetobacter entanii]|uniref:Uncharacterized protein n=1 Tax=Gluconacetobacter entanii TaxID=108528 RepID=A0A318PUU3_9PROT|nr:hypothetical protein [Gluconacetobacter entanii]MBE7618252.1 hypothetical protein [Komagataeibacter sp. FXV2]MCE2578833.1 hypothetical protein [Komagataeibacter sp. FNDCR1]PYD62322.1 hypothetical protein CFR72_13110 [Gluconacetobacter entanii]
MIFPDAAFFLKRRYSSEAFEKIFTRNFFGFSNVPWVGLWDHCTAPARAVRDGNCCARHAIFLTDSLQQDQEFGQ